MILGCVVFAAVKLMGYSLLANARADKYGCNSSPFLIALLQIVLGGVGFWSLGAWIGPLLDNYFPFVRALPGIVWFIGLLALDRLFLWYLLFLIFYRRSLKSTREIAKYLASSVAYSFFLDVPAFGMYLLVGGDPLGRC